jgi:hypothetical protein
MHFASIVALSSSDRAKSGKRLHVVWLVTDASQSGSDFESRACEFNLAGSWVRSVWGIAIMMNSFDEQSWREYESVQWHRAVRYRGLRLHSLDPDERLLVFNAITADLERRKTMNGENVPLERPAL